MIVINKCPKCGRERLDNKLCDCEYKLPARDAQDLVLPSNTDPIKITILPPEDMIMTGSTKPNFDTTIKEFNTTIQKDNTTKEQEQKEIVVDWSPIIGYQEIKDIITKTLNAKYDKKKVHILIIGAAGTSKTVFLKTIESSLKAQQISVHYLDATTLTSAGVIEYIFSNDIHIGLLDEIDKLEKEHQKTFLNLLESGIIQETKSRKIRMKKMDKTIWICTGNYIEKIMYPLLTRMLVLRIPAYTEAEFINIGTQLLQQQYNKTEEIARYIVTQVWELCNKSNNDEKPNLRDAVRIAILTYNVKDEKQQIDSILAGMEKYSTTHYE